VVYSDIKRQRNEQTDGESKTAEQSSEDVTKNSSYVDFADFVDEHDNQIRSFVCDPSTYKSQSNQ